MATDLIASIGLGCHLFSELTADDEGLKLGFCWGQENVSGCAIDLECLKKNLVKIKITA